MGQISTFASAYYLTVIITALLLAFCGDRLDFLGITVEYYICFVSSNGKFTGGKILAIAVSLKYISEVDSNPLQTSFRDIVPSNGSGKNR
ncbi:MAG: hypothetical protein QNJ64_07440 [Crocosphaera sp.]|nr:hypothetical protein [Crocosphaera sp.]